MAININFESFSDKDYKYSDLSLDLEREFIPLGQSHLYRESGSADIKTDFDERAIANSLRNLFGTRPKQRLLNPEYGLDFSQFLFEKANEFSGRLIARKINQGIMRFEPRVNINFIDVVVDEENNLYNISINLNIPSIRKNVSFNSVFNENGFDL